jgi:hypothetical protein
LLLIIEQKWRRIQQLVKPPTSGETRTLGVYNSLVTLTIFDYTESVRKKPAPGTGW